MSEPLGAGAMAGRRRFLQWLGFTGLWGALGTRLGMAQGPPLAVGRDSSPATPSGAPPDSAARAPGTPEPPSEPARTLARLLRERYPKAIAEADLERVARDLDGDLRAGVRLRAAKLTNADEPDFTFRA